jgi:putative transposase
MTRVEVKTASAAVKELLLQSPDGLREVVRAVIQEMLEAEMAEALGAERASARRSVWATGPALTAAR